MPATDIQIDGKINLTPEISDKDMSAKLIKTTGRVSETFKKQLTKALLEIVAEGRAKTGIQARQALLQGMGLKPSEVTPKGWKALQYAQTQTEKIRTGFDRVKKQEKLDTERSQRQAIAKKEREEKVAQKLQEREEKTARDLQAKQERERVALEQKQQKEFQKKKEKEEKFALMTPAQRVYSGVGTKEDYQLLADRLQENFTSMKETGTTKGEYSKIQGQAINISDLISGKIGLLEKQGEGLDKRTKEFKDINSIATDLRKIKKDIEPITKSAKESGVRIKGEKEDFSGFLSKFGRLLAGFGLAKKVANFVLGAGKYGEKQAMSEFSTELIYGTPNINTLSRFLQTQKISEGTAKQFLGSVADFAQAEKWGKISGEQYTGLSLLSSASGYDLLSMMRSGDSEGIMKALRKIRSTKSLSANEMRNYIRMAGWSEEMMAANAPELFKGEEISKGIEFQKKITAVNRASALQNMRSSYLKTLNYNRMASGVNYITTGSVVDPWSYIDKLSGGGAPGYSKSSTTNISIGNVSVDASNKNNGKEIGQDFIDTVSDKSLWQQNVNQQIGSDK